MKINLEKSALIAEIVGGAAVIISVIYLTYEVRQNTAATRSLTHQQLFDSTLELNQSIAVDPALADLLTRSKNNFRELSESEQTQLFMLFVNYFNMWDSAHSNHQKELLDANAWNVWNTGMTWYMREYDSAREIWKRSNHFYNTDFRAHVSAILAKRLE